MRWLVNYIRSVFCKHDWEREDFIFRVTRNILGDESGREGARVSATCKKCGWHRSYWKV